MITIGICEDIKETRKEITLICKEVIDFLQINCKILEFADGETLLSYQELLDILILDIELPMLNGIDIKNQLQKEMTDTLIIFVTNHEELIREAFGIHVIGFVDKCKMRKQLEKVLKLALQMNKYIILEEGIDSRDIIYIRADHGYTEVIMKNKEKFLLYKSLNDLEKSLQEVDFVRIHRSYLVNLRWVKEVGEKQVTVLDKKLSISVRKRVNVKTKYDMYCKKNARYY